ncbi:hypothetical protein VTN77DRAFT_8452 [Rasamsonia byssochlamydoides]|uniref:uncharacterized protein n=1 Tax=Rasamsonia byssochlamydoides TaxID=89139 RepID=UPI003742C4BD
MTWLTQAVLLHPPRSPKSCTTCQSGGSHLFEWQRVQGLRPADRLSLYACSLAVCATRTEVFDNKEQYQYIRLQADTLAWGASPVSLSQLYDVSGNRVDPGLKA